MSDNCKDIEKCLEVAKKLALEAGEIFKSAILLEKKLDTKSAHWDLVTEYDKKIEDLLVKGLLAHFPDHKIVAEESTAAANSLPELTDSPTWLIDPIDGTTNFVHGFSQCCISIGLAIGKSPQLGLIYNPMSNEIFTAIRGQGAFLNGRRLNVSKITELKKSLIYIEPGRIRVENKNRDIALGRLEALVSSSQGMRSIGSAALGFGYVASGSLDAMQIDNLGPWDVAAGVLLVKEAGGVIIDRTGGPFDMMRANTIAASSESLAREISKLVIDTDLQTQRKRFKRVPSSSKLL